MISVALCTYNGERYIREQLKSILNQTVKVDEIVVCDDGSTDNTLQIIEGLACTTDTAIHIHRNETNLGPAKNFQKAINLCSGDIIFLSDQDDVWVPEKVATITNYFKQNPHISVVFTDGNLMADNTLIGSLWQCFGITSKSIKAIDNGFGIELFACESRATGATMAVRNTFEPIHTLNHYQPSHFLHDEILSMLALYHNQLGYCPEKLINYRIHPNQECGLGERLINPASDDIRETSNLALLWSRLALPNTLQERITFIATRDRRKHQPFGPIRMIGNLKIYRMLYHSQWCSFLLFDIRKWSSVMLHRIIK